MFLGMPHHVCLTLLCDVKKHSFVSYQRSGGFLHKGEVLLQDGHQKVTRAESKEQHYTRTGQEVNLCEGLLN